MSTKILSKYTAILILLVGIYSLSDLAYAQTGAQLQNQIKDNIQRIEIIDGKVSDLKENYRLLYDGAKNQNDQLGNQISFAGYLLGGFSFFFTILGFFLAWYINRQSEKVKDMKDIVEITQKAIDGHSADLYEKLKREETLSLLKRLKEVPEDILNISHLLLSRDLLEHDFLYLKEPYLKINDGRPLDKNAQDSYITLLMQHFPYESLVDQDLKDEIILNINTENLNLMFPRDVRNFFEQIVRYVKEFGIDTENSKTIIWNLFYYYSKSKFHTNVELQNYIKEILSKNSMRTPLVASVLKEKASTEAAYTTWIDIIFI